MFDGHAVSILQDENALEIRCMAIEIHITPLGSELNTVEMVRHVLYVFYHS